MKYEKIDVWKKVDDKCLIRFRCYKVLGKEKYYVQSSDYFYLPISSEKLMLFESQQLELFLDIEPNERTSSFASLEEAIDEHEKEFNFDLKPDGF